MPLSIVKHRTIILFLTFLTILIFTLSANSTSYSKQNLDTPSPITPTPSLQQSPPASATPRTGSRNRPVPPLTTANGFNFGVFTQQSYDDFIAANGSTSFNSSNSALRLTGTEKAQSGSAWYYAKQVIGYGFESNFQYHLTGVTGGTPVNGADGFAFLVQNSGDLALGNGGCQMGYGGISNAVGVEFDTFINNPGSNICSNIQDQNNQHVSLQAEHRGMYGNIYASHLDGYTLKQQNAGTKLNDGAVHQVRMVYLPPQRRLMDVPTYAGCTRTTIVDFQELYGTWCVYIDDMNSPFLIHQYVRDLWDNPDFGVGLTSDGYSYVGFTAGTGGNSQNHDLLSWSFQPFVCVSAAGQVVAKQSVSGDCIPLATATPTPTATATATRTATPTLTRTATPTAQVTVVIGTVVTLVGTPSDECDPNASSNRSKATSLPTFEPFGKTTPQARATSRSASIPNCSIITSTPVITRTPATCVIQLVAGSGGGLAQRESPTKYSPRLNTIPWSTTLTALQRLDVGANEIWLQVRFNNNDGWIAARISGIDNTTSDPSGCNALPPYPVNWDTQIAQLTSNKIIAASGNNTCDVDAYLRWEASQDRELVLARLAFAEAASYKVVPATGESSGGIVFDDALRISWLVRMDAMIGLPNYGTQSKAGISVGWVDQILAPSAFQPITDLKTQLSSVACNPNQIDAQVYGNVRRMVFPENSSVADSTHPAEIYQLYRIYRNIQTQVKNGVWDSARTGLSDIVGFEQFKGVPVDVNCNTVSGANGLARPGSGFSWASNQPFPPKATRAYLHPDSARPQANKTCYQDAYHLDDLFWSVLSGVSSPDLPSLPSTFSSDVFPLPANHSTGYDVIVLKNPSDCNDKYSLAQLTGKNGNPWPTLTRVCIP